MGIALRFSSNNLSNFTVMRNASGVNQFKAVDQNGNNGMLFKVKDNSEFSVNVWKDNAFGNEKILATKDDLNTWENITSDCTLANGISIGTFKVYKNTAQKLIKMNGYLTITSEQKVAKTLLTFPSNIKLIGYQYVLAYNANTADSYGVYGTDANVLRNDTKNIPVMNYFVIPNVTMSYDL